jgi:WD40 repeat protein
VVQHCAFSPDGRWIVSGSDDGTLKVWDADTGTVLRTLTGHTDLSNHPVQVNCCAFRPDGRQIVSGNGYFDGTLMVWDADSGAVVRHLSTASRLMHNAVFDCAFSPDGRTIVSAGAECTLTVWDAGTDAAEAGNRVPGLLFPDLMSETPQTLTGHSGFVFGFAFSPDGRWIVSASDDHTLRVWQVGSGSLVARIEVPGGVSCVLCHPWLPWVTCGDADGDLYRIEVVGIDMDPIVVTATRCGPELVVRCPACQTEHPVEQTQLGCDLVCPTEACGLNLQVNPFVLTPS